MTHYFTKTLTEFGPIVFMFFTALQISEYITPIINQITETFVEEFLPGPYSTTYARIISLVFAIIILGIIYNYILMPMYGSSRQYGVYF